MGVLRGRDFWSGATFIAISAWFFWRGRTYEFGTASAMGPGFFPVVISAALGLVGVVILLNAIARESGPIERPVLRPVLFVLAAIAVFAVCIGRFGLLPATLTSIALAAPGARGFRWLEVIALAVGMAAFSAFVFVYALNQNIPLVRL